MVDQSAVGFIDRCMEGLRGLPFVRSVERVADNNHDLRIRIGTPRKTVVLPCEIHRSHLGKEGARFLIQMAKENPDFVVLAPAVSQELGDQFERASVNFVDLSGNCYLQLGEDYIARVQGRKTVTRKPSDQAWRAPSYRVLFALMVQPDLLRASARELGAIAEVSPQTANAVRNRLVHQGLALRAHGRHTWSPNAPSQVLSLWVSGFASTLASSLLIGRFRAREAKPIELEQRIEPLLDAICDWRYGGGAAAHRLTGYYRGDRTVLYLDRPPRNLPAKLKLIPDINGPITVARRLNQLSFASPAPRSVHPLLVYSDLLSENDERAYDAAQVLYESHLHRLLEGP